ncbi:hypothetical protein D3C73_757090 [compost metagenome]
MARDAGRLLEMEQNIDPDRFFGHGGHFTCIILDGRAEKPFLIFVGVSFRIVSKEGLYLFFSSSLKVP